MRLTDISGNGIVLLDHIDIDEDFIKIVLLENQERYLTNKYPEVSPELVRQAIAFDRRNAEKLIFGLKNGVIQTIDDAALAAVSDLDPLAKVSNKSEADLKYEEDIKSAKQISRNHWQWVLKQRRLDPSVQFDQSWFDYIDAEQISPEDLKNLSAAEVQSRSEAWHEEQFANQRIGGTYSLGPDSPEAYQVGPYYWLPVTEKDAILEGAKMQNCIGRYCKPSEHNKIYSMRNRLNNPHISMSVKNEYGSGTWGIAEIKGKNNKAPIPKYIPFLLPFISKLLEDGVKISASSDFWRLPAVNFDKYINYYVGNIFSPYGRGHYQETALLSKISDEALNKYALNIMANNREIFPDDYAIDDFVQRLTPDTIHVLLRSISPDNSSKLLIRAATHRKLTEDFCNKMMEEGKLPRSTQLVILSVYHPEQFITQLQKSTTYDVAELYIKSNSYYEAIKAFKGNHPYFQDLAIQLIQAFGVPPLRRGQKTEQLRYIELLSKTSVQFRYDLLSDPSKYITGEQPAASDTIKYCALVSLSDILTSTDFEAKYRILQFFRPSQNSYLSMRDNEVLTNAQLSFSLAENIIYNCSIEQLRSLKSLNIPILNRIIQMFVIDTKNTLQSDTSLPVSHEDPDEAMDYILQTDDPEQLRQYRQNTKLPNIQIMIDRKLSRLQRLSDVTDK